MKENTQRQVVPADRLEIKELLMIVIARWPLLLLGGIVGLVISWTVNRYQKDIYQVEAVLNVEQVENPLAQSGISLVVNTFGENQLEVKQLVLKSLELNKKAARKLGWEVYYFIEGNLSSKELYGDLPVKVHFDRSHTQPIGISFYIEPKEESFKLSWDEDKTGASGYSYETEQPVSVNDDRLPEGEFKYGQWIEGEGYKFKLDKTQYWNSYPKQKIGAMFKSIQSIARQNRGSLIIEPSKGNGATTMTLLAQGTNPYKLSDMVNGTVEALRSHELERKNERAKNTLLFIDDQLKGVLGELKSSEGILEDFRATNLIVDLSAESQSLLGQFSEIDNSLTQNAFLQRYYEYVIEFLNRNTQLQGLSLPPLNGLEDPVVATLTQRLIELNSSLETAKYTLSVSNPEYQRLVKELTYTKESLKQATLNALDHAKSIEKDLQERFLELQEGVTSLPSKEQQYVNIQRRYETYGRQYEMLLQKRAEAGILQASNLPDTQVIEPATFEGERPISPNRMQNLLLGFGAGVGLPILLVILFDTLNNKIRSRKDIELMTSIPILGGVGHSKHMDELIVVKSPKSMVAESFRGLRANLSFIVPGIKPSMTEPGKIIMVTSSIGGEGKTFVSSNLALTLAASGLRTCLIGADLRKPKILLYFDEENNQGLSNYLSEEDLSLSLAFSAAARSAELETNIAVA